MTKLMEQRENKLRTFRCPKGHEIKMVCASYTVLFVAKASTEECRHINYCLECFGEWAAQKWPFQEVEDDGTANTAT